MCVPTPNSQGPDNWFCWLGLQICVLILAQVYSAGLFCPHLWAQLVQGVSQLVKSGEDISMAWTKLTLKHQETHGCLVSTVATDVLVLKHQAISIHNAD